jgi:hypothetical protein
VDGYFVPYDVVVVVPGLNIPSGTSRDGDWWSEESRRARDANFTESLRNQSEWQRGRVAVFGQPNASLSTVYWESARDIAEVIARAALEANPLPKADALAVFAAAAEYARYREDFADAVPIKNFWGDLVHDRMRDLARSLVKKYTDEAKLAIAQQAAGWGSHPEDEATKLADAAKAEYRREFDAMPAQLRSMTGEASINHDLWFIEFQLVNSLPIAARSAASNRRRELQRNDLLLRARALLGTNAA